MKFVKYLFFVLFLGSFSVHSQVDFALLNAKTSSEIDSLENASLKSKENTLVSFDFIEAENILWSKMVWEYIDLKDKLNYPLYYPVDSTNVESDRRSLFINLLKGIKSGKITEVYEDSYFNVKLSLKEIEDKMTRIDTADSGFELLNQGETDISAHIDRISLQSQDIMGYYVRGIWYFDKKYSELRYRTLAIAPVAPDVQTIGKKNVNAKERLPIFWVFYNNARPVLHDAKVFNPKNRKTRMSFDAIFTNRRFYTTVYREENVFGNRNVDNYIKKDKFREEMESMRIKEQIRNRELDMWNY